MTTTHDADPQGAIDPMVQSLFEELNVSNQHLLSHRDREYDEEYELANTSLKLAIVHEEAAKSIARQLSARLAADQTDAG